MSLGLDLHLDLSPVRPGRSLEAALRAAILDGRLSPDTRLPAARTLAADLGISRNTVADVYAQLAAEGWLESRVGAGTWVSVRTPSYVQAGLRQRTVRRRWIDLRGGIPDTAGFARREWASAARQATLDATTAELGYPDPAGTTRLRGALTSYLARTRGVAVERERVVVGQGFGELLVLLCRALRQRGATRIAVEEYGHDHHRRLIASTGITPVPVAVDEDGADVQLLEKLDVSAVLLTPAHQFPVGVPLAADRRRWLVGWAEWSDALVIEDDYDGEFRYDRRAIGALQSLAPERVAYLGTASKAVAPAVGLAWGVLPTWLLPDVLEQRALSGGQPAALHQLALARFVEAHDYDRTVRRLRATYRSRRRHLEEVVADRLPGCEVTGLAAGLQCLLTLPAGAAEEVVEQEATARGLRLEGLGSFRFGPGREPHGPALVIGYGGPTPGQYETAIELLVESIRASVRRRAD
ncbi:MocR-like pyridoxine biosynthesis transcription factor PdxR [Micromonospora globbae]|uniref:MocR-like pyridoxine biosynthesis transcription factor PdxR n=1 Tax=Micromonospora globbae TaxID=1894969 RepID=UPI0037B9399E